MQQLPRMVQRTLDQLPATKTFQFIAWKGTEASVHLGGKLSVRLV